MNSLHASHGRSRSVTLEGRGFTLLEILVGLVLLSILSLLFFLVYPKVQVMSRNTQCMSHLRILHQAALLYANDRGGKLPDLVYWRDEREKYGIPNWSLLPYLEYNPTALSCPVTEADAQFRPVTSREWDATYSINVHMIGSNESGGSIANWEDWKGKNPIAWVLNRVSRPEEAPFFMDGPGIKDSFGTRYSVFTQLIRASTDPGDRPGGQWATPYLHPGAQVNVVFVDGHVESLSRTKIKEMNWSGQ